MPGEQSVSEILESLSGGDRAAVDQLFPLVYDQLRRLANGYLQQERRAHTLRATALVHEAYLKLADQKRANWRDRAHFMAVAAQAMRRILVDHARRRAAVKRGGNVRTISIDDALDVSNKAPSTDLLALDSALARLQSEQPEKAAVVEMRFFGGLDDREIAEVLSVSTRTVNRYWKYAQAWLYRDLRDSSPP